MVVRNSSVVQIERMHSLFFGVLLLAVAVHAEGDGCISVGTCMRSNKEKHTRVEAMWLWDVQLTWETFAQESAGPDNQAGVLNCECD